MSKVSQKVIILLQDEYAWILDNDNGKISLVEGGARFSLKSNQEMYGDVFKKLILRDNEFVTVSNPFNKENERCMMGECEIRTGPAVMSLYPFETCSEPKSAYVLKQGQGLKLQANEDIPESKRSVARKAGEMYIVPGPASYIPSKFELVKEIISAINVPQNQGVYVRDIRTSRLRLIEGPQSLLLGVNDELFKRFHKKEVVSTLELPNASSEWAPTIVLEKGSVVCIMDSENDTEKYIEGPRVYILGPYEIVKVNSLSGGVPKKENTRQAAIVHVEGVDFMVDQFQVSTKDHALLDISISYKWQFLTDKSNPAAEYPKIFALDFIGYPCQSLQSRIREEAAKHYFEALGSNTAEILRNRVFREYTFSKYGENGGELKIRGRFFPECCVFVSEIDIKEVKPVNEDIAELLNESIRTNMKIVCQKLEDQATLQQEKEEIDSKRMIETLRKDLISNNNINYRKQTLDRAIIQGEADREKAKAASESYKILEEGAVSRDLARMKSTIEKLNSENGSAYLQMLKLESMSHVKNVTVLPSNVTNIKLPNFPLLNSV